MMGLVSIIVPCYNVGAFLAETLDSVLTQSYASWECIIVNDGSTDNTHEIALEWENKDNRFIYLKLENGGVERARNKGIERAKGEYILPLDGDDKIAPNFLEKTVKVFSDDPDTMLVYTMVQLFDAEEGLWNLKEFSLQDLAVDNMIVCTALFRKREWVRTGGYDEKARHQCEDWELWINMLKNGGKVVRVNEPLFLYRIRPTSAIRTRTEEKIMYMRRYLTSKHYAFFHEQLGDPISLYWEAERYKDKLKYYTELVQQLTLRNRLKRLVSLPIRAILKAEQMLRGKSKNESIAE
jgi:glycosyltransferase involved in cell wall biosynthesis